MKKSTIIYIGVVISVILVVFLALFAWWEGARLPFFVAMLSVVFVILLLLLLLKALRQTISNMNLSVEKAITVELQNFINEADKLIASKVTTIGSRDELIEAIATLYFEASKYADQQAASINGDITAQINVRPVTVTLFGASEIQPPPSDRISSSENEGENVHERLERARLAAEKSGVRFQRYVRLFSKDNFAGRSFEMRKGYLQWLKNQVSLMKRFDGYILLDAKRAPRWKAIRSSVSGVNSHIDILGDGESGFIITGEEFVIAQNRSARNFLVPAGSGRSGIIEIYDSDKLNLLNKHLKKMTKIHEKVTKAEEKKSKKTKG